MTILWNQQVQTDRTIPNNKPDIIIQNNEKGTCMLIDVTISGDRNVIKKEAEKILKYKDLTIEIQHMWNVKTKVIPVIIGATETISKSFRKHTSNIAGRHKSVLIYHLFFIPWIRTGLQNPYGYGNHHVCLRGLVAKSE